MEEVDVPSLKIYKCNFSFESFGSQVNDSIKVITSSPKKAMDEAKKMIFCTLGIDEEDIKIHSAKLIGQLGYDLPTMGNINIAI